MKIILLLLGIVYSSYTTFSQKKITIVNLSEQQINYVYKDCFLNDSSLLIKPHQTAVIRIDSLLTLPLQVFFPNSGNLFNSVFCLEDDTLKISSNNGNLTIKNSSLYETALFKELNKLDFYSQILWTRLGYNSKKPNIEAHFKKCKEAEKRSLYFLDSLTKLTNIRVSIKKIIDLNIRLNILGTYLTPGYVWGNEILFVPIQKEYIDSVLSKSIILNKIPPEWSQYSQLTLFNLVRFLRFSNKVEITQETIFNVFKEQYVGFDRDIGCFQSLKFAGEKVSLKLYNEFVEFAEDKKYSIYFKNKIDEMSAIRSLDLFTMDKDRFLSNRKLEFNLPEIMYLNNSHYYYIDFWATWCRPCLEELAFSKILHKKYSILGISFIYISIDDDFENFQNRMIGKELPIKSSYLLNKVEESEIAKKIKLTSVPRYLIVNDKGQILDSDAPRPSDPNIQKIFDELLKK